MLTVGIAARTLAVAVDVGSESPGDIAVLGQATVDEGRGLIVLRRNGCGIFVRHAVVEFVHRDGPYHATLEQRHQTHRLWHFALCVDDRSEEHTSELQSLMRISYAVFCLKKKNKIKKKNISYYYHKYNIDRIQTK